MKLPQLIMGLRESLGLYSQRLNVFVSITVAYIVATNGADIPAILDKIPAPYSYVVAPLAGYITFLIVSYARLWPQSKDVSNGLDADNRPSV